MSDKYLITKDFADRRHGTITGSDRDPIAGSVPRSLPKIDVIVMTR